MCTLVVYIVHADLIKRETDVFGFFDWDLHASPLGMVPEAGIRRVGDGWLSRLDTNVGDEE